MANLPYQPIRDKLRLLSGNVTLRVLGTDTYIKAGSYDNFTFEPNNENVDVFSKQTGVKQKVATYTVARNGTLKFDGIQNWDDFVFETLYMADKSYIVKSAVVNQTLVIDKWEVGRPIRIDLPRVSITSIEDEGTATFVEGVHYTHSAKHKFLDPIAVPDGTTGKITITYSAAAVLSSEKRTAFEMMRNDGLRVEVILTNVRGGGLPGEEKEYVFAEVLFKPDGAISMSGIEDVAKASIMGEVFLTPSGDYGRINELFD